MGTLTDLLSGAKEDLPPAPDDLDERDDDELPADPIPSRRRTGRRTPARAARATAKATQAERQQVQDALTMLYTLPAWGLQLKDSHCGGVLQAERDSIIKALTPIVCRNPAMLAFFTAANAPWMDYLALFTALKPVAGAVWSHHVTKTVGSGEDDQPAGGGLVDLSRYTA